LVHKIPENLGFEEAALIEPLACAVHGVQETTRITAGDTVLVSGPGAVGLFVSQLAAADGGTVIVCGTSVDEEKLKIASNLGAAYTVNVEKDNLQEKILEVTKGEGVHLAIECAGVEASAEQCLKAVRKGGRYHQMGIFGKSIRFDMDQALFREMSLTSSWGNTDYGFRRGLELLASGKVRATPMITAKLPLEEWKKGFDMVENKTGIKVLLYP
jgi:L-iditol 2-dehydrogenase